MEKNFLNKNLDYGLYLKSVNPILNRIRPYQKTARFIGRVAKEIVFTKNQSHLARNLKDEIVRMGPVYVKIGQIISTRTDIFPDYLTEVFSDLQNDVEFMEFERVNSVFRSQFGEDIDHYFTDFTESPIASASVGQVHVGVLKKHNKKVAVKVLREGIKEKFEIELKSIIDMMRLYTAIFGKNNKNITDSLQILQEQYNSIDSETDLERELENMIVFHRILSSNNNILVPRVYKPLSSSQVLTMEYLPSAKITELENRSNKEVAITLMRSFILMILNDGYLHCDPHPGNIGITPDNRIVLYDFGLVKEFSLDIKSYFKKIFFALMNQSSDDLINFMLDSKIIVASESNASSIGMLTGYERIFLDRLVRYVYIYLNNLDVYLFLESIENDVYIDINDVPFTFDTQLVYLFKSFSTLEGVCKQIYSEFNYIELLSNFVFDFFDVDMLIDKATYDIKNTTMTRNGTMVTNTTTSTIETYTKLSIEKMNKRFDTNTNIIRMSIFLSLLFDIFIMYSNN